MKQNGHSRFANGLRRVAIAIVASASVAAPAVYADASNIVPNMVLPDSARQTGEAIKRPPVESFKDRWQRDYELGLAGAG
jgi:hypothetical protein